MTKDGAMLWELFQYVGSRGRWESAITQYNYCMYHWQTQYQITCTCTHKLYNYTDTVTNNFLEPTTMQLPVKGLIAVFKNLQSKNLWIHSNAAEMNSVTTCTCTCRSRANKNMTNKWIHINTTTLLTYILHIYK